MSEKKTGPVQAEIVLRGEMPPAIQEPSVGLMLQGMLTSVQTGEVTGQTVEIMKGMMDLYNLSQDRQAARDFSEALVGLQGETGRVAATKAVEPRPDGTCRYRFAPYEEIMLIVQPMLTKHGFSITFDTEMGEHRLTSVCTLTHKSGHSRQNRFAVKYAKPPGSSEAQGDMSTKSYAKRGALCDALNIVIDKDNDGAGMGDDAKSDGAPVTEDQAADLWDLCEATGTDKVTFLKSAGGVKKFEEIPASRFDDLQKMLKKKETSR